MPPSLPTPFLTLDSPQATLQTVGGKGANLARLKRQGFPVPDGFLIPTTIYADFVSANRLDEIIQNALQTLDADPDALEDAAQRIRSRFSACPFPPSLAQALEQAYAWLGAPPVAVRSSATAEDLPELSFAGQQDTYLNILGVQALSQAITACWGSLWTARAIGYRRRNSIPQDEVTLAVVVQAMVPSEASGVLFTANPLSGLRTETVIDATLGLGEALVSGQVEPDHYVVDARRGAIVAKTLGAKATVITGQPGGGTHTRRGDASTQQAIPDEAILELTRLGQRVAAEYNFPQDIEWAWVGGKLSLLQTRPITSLFPLPQGLPPEPLKVFFSFAAVQGMLDPLTPLGQDTLRMIFSAGASLFGERVTPESQKVLYTAGERLWVNFTPILSNSFGRRAVHAALSMVEPTVRQAVEQIQDDPRLQPARPGVSWHARSRMAHFFIPLAANVLLNLISPRRRREYIIRQGEKILEEVERRCAAIQGDRRQKLAQQANLLPELYARELPRTFILFVSAVASGVASWNFLDMLAGKAAQEQPSTAQPSIGDLVLQVTRGMPFNPTTEMDLDLWHMAQVIRLNPASWEVFQNNSAAELAARYQQGDLPPVAAQRVQQFLRRYGGRGLGEIDLGRTRWAEDPTHVFEMLSSFLQIENTDQAPDVVFARGAQSAQKAVDRLAHAVRQTRRGWLKSRLLRFFAGRARQLMGARESPKFFAVRMMHVIHRALLQTGQEYTQAGELERPDDLFYLSLAELQAFAAREERDWHGLINNRRAAYQRERLRRQIPRLLLSDGRAFYEGMNDVDAAENTIHGSPVSPGSVEGQVRVVLDPRQAGLLPGEILVCPGTDPSWTPLFLSAAGLVMEVGGMMTHGAVVAREYGIPAIVGVDRATTRLKTGQRIRVDGSTGQIILVQHDASGVKSSGK